MITAGVIIIMNDAGRGGFAGPERSRSFSPVRVIQSPTLTSAVLPHISTRSSVIDCRTGPPHRTSYFHHRDIDAQTGGAVLLHHSSLLPREAEDFFATTSREFVADADDRLLEK